VNPAVEVVLAMCASKDMTLLLSRFFKFPSLENVLQAIQHGKIRITAQIFKI